MDNDLKINDKNPEKAETNKHNNTKKYKRITEIIVSGLVIFFIIVYTRFSNVCTYTKLCLSCSIFC